MISSGEIPLIRDKGAEELTEAITGYPDAEAGGGARQDQVAEQQMLFGEELRPQVRE